MSQLTLAAPDRADGLVAAPVEATEVFRVTGIPRDVAPLLEVGRGAHGFHATRVTYDGREAFEHTTSYLRGDRYEIRLSLRNTG